MYDGLLQLKMPAGTDSVVSADGACIVEVAATKPSLELILDETLRMTHAWLARLARLVSRSDNKFECLFFTNKIRK